MIETIAVLSTILIPVVLLVSWFRYRSLLLLSATGQSHAATMAAEHGLEFREVQFALQTRGNEILDFLLHALDKDYAALQLLGLDTGESSSENRMLRAHYKIMRAWFRVSRLCLPGAGKQALHEMALIIGHFAESLGECAVPADELGTSSLRRS